MFLSSHLLDEVEKTCDAAAIVDRGRVITQGSIGELAGADGHQLRVGCDDLTLAVRTLDAHPAVTSLDARGDHLFLAVDDDRTAAAAVNAALVHAGVAVFRLEPVRSTLEQRFLELTGSLGPE